MFACSAIKAESRVQLLATLGPQNDPWLKASAELFHPLLSIASFADANHESALNLDLAPACDPAVRLLASGKPSHQALACCGTALLGITGFHGWKMAKMADPSEGIITPSGASAMVVLADSTNFWARKAGIVASGMSDGGKAESQVLNALTSPDDLDRLAGLAGCFIMRTPGIAQRLDVPARNAVLAALHSPSYAESSLAARVAICRIPFDDLLSLLRDEAERKSSGRFADALVTALAECGWQLSDKQQAALLRAALDSKDPSLQVRLANGMRGEYERSDPLIAALIRDCELPLTPELLAAINELKAYKWMENDIQFKIRRLQEMDKDERDNPRQ